MEGDAYAAIVFTWVLAEPQFGRTMVMDEPDAGEPVAADPISSELKDIEICPPGVSVKAVPGDRISAAEAAVVAVQVPPAVATKPVNVGAGEVPVLVPANCI